jgi:hypothetical protein
MSGAIPPLPNTPSCRGAQLKHRDNFTFTSAQIYIIVKMTRPNLPSSHVSSFLVCQEQMGERGEKEMGKF